MRAARLRQPRLVGGQFELAGPRRPVEVGRGGGRFAGTRRRRPAPGRIVRRRGGAPAGPDRRRAETAHPRAGGPAGQPRWRAARGFAVRNCPSSTGRWRRRPRRSLHGSRPRRSGSRGFAPGRPGSRRRTGGTRETGHPGRGRPGTAGPCASPPGWRYGSSAPRSSRPATNLSCSVVRPSSWATASGARTGPNRVDQARSSRHSSRRRKSR